MFIPSLGLLQFVHMIHKLPVAISTRYFMYLGFHEEYVVFGSNGITEFLLHAKFAPDVMFYEYLVDSDNGSFPAWQCCCFSDPHCFPL